MRLVHERPLSDGGLWLPDAPGISRDLIELDALLRPDWDRRLAALAGSDVLIAAITAGDLVYRLSGGASNTSPAAALGGAMSTVAGGIITSAVLNNLFDDVAPGEASAGDIEYRCIYIQNNHGSLTWQAVALWIDSLTSSSGTEFDIGLDPAAIGSSSSTTIANENTAPSGVTFSRPTTKGAGLLNLDIPAGSRKAFWVRRTVTAGAGAASDSGSIRAEGDTAA